MNGDYKCKCGAVHATNAEVEKMTPADWQSFVAMMGDCPTHSAGTETPLDQPE